MRLETIASTLSTHTTDIASNATSIIDLVADALTFLKLDGSRSMTGDLKLPLFKKLIVDNDLDTYIVSELDDHMLFVAGGAQVFWFKGSSMTFKRSMNFEGACAFQATCRPNVDGGINFGTGVARWASLYLYPLTDATRPAPSGAGRVIYNDDDKSLNVDDGTNWRDMAGNIT